MSNVWRVQLFAFCFLASCSLSEHKRAKVSASDSASKDASGSWGPSGSGPAARFSLVDAVVWMQALEEAAAAA